MTSLVNGSNNSYTYTYDADGSQLTKTETIKGTTKITAYEYDKAGRLTEEAREGGKADTKRKGIGVLGTIGVAVAIVGLLLLFTGESALISLLMVVIGGGVAWWQKV